MSTIKQAMSCFGTGVTIITTHHAGQDFGMTCNSFNTVSLDPPLVLWSIRQSSSNRAHFELAGGYTVNILSAAQHSLAHRFSQGSQKERFEQVELAQLSTQRSRLIGSVAWFDCALERIIPAGDHDIMLGRVLDFGVNEDLSIQPLLYAQRQFGTLQPH